jgi:hypothetical protein
MTLGHDSGGSPASRAVQVLSHEVQQAPTPMWAGTFAHRDGCSCASLTTMRDRVEVMNVVPKPSTRVNDAPGWIDSFVSRPLYGDCALSAAFKLRRARRGT